MVASKSVSQSAKRKKTADMPESPPKRVTRARAKATVDGGTKTKTTKITTASARASVAIMPVIEPAKPIRRKTRADDEATEPIQAPVAATAQQGKPIKAGPKPKKPTNDHMVNNQDDVIEVPMKTRGRPAKVAAAEQKKIIEEATKSEAPKPRGRPKKPANTATSVSTNVEVSSKEVEQVKRATRGRPLLVGTKAATTSAVEKPPMARKRVKFLDESNKDKENMPILEKNTKSAMTTIGLRAKPVRKPAVPRVNGRKKTIVGEASQAKERAVEEEIRPLSPKKVTQIAKTSSTSSEDELSGDKTPMRVLSKSPVKPPMSILREMNDRVPKLELSTTVLPTSPAKNSSSTILRSPARRPPPSPFKDALKGSPKRGNLGEHLVSATLSSSQSPVKILFRESAKRINIGEATMQPSLLPSKSPMKTSLLQSPARRPVGSPMKTAIPKTPSKSGIAFAVEHAANASQQASTCEGQESLSQQSLGSPLPAANTTAQSKKTHKIIAADQSANIPNATPNSIPVEGFLRDSKEDQKSLAHTPTKFFEERVGLAESGCLLGNTSSAPKEFADTSCSGSKARVEVTEHLVDNSGDIRSTTPPDPPAVSMVSTFLPSRATFRNANTGESDSEDELASPQKGYVPTPLARHTPSTRAGNTIESEAIAAEGETPGGRVQGVVSHGTLHSSRSPKPNVECISMTPLALQLSSWLASSPEKKTPGRGLFPPRGPTALDRAEQIISDSPLKNSFFEDEMVMRDADCGMYQGQPDTVEGSGVEVQASQDSQASEEYGDENAVPVDPQLLETQTTIQSHVFTCTPARVFSEQPREIRTVSKVPLRPAGDDSPRKVPRKRTRSLVIPTANLTTSSKSQDRIIFAPTEAGDLPIFEYAVPIEADPSTPRAAGSGSVPSTGTTTGPFRKMVNPGVLKGAVVYVDVHTTEGADASGIFVELLTQMGARCVKQWLWNGRVSVAGPPDEANASPDSGTLGGKIGITHVVYKDGGKRTLEKVRESKGVVLCVGVGWVLDCERESKWLDEVNYAIDTSMIPRGGHRRRKSMEPRMLSNINGSLFSAETPARVSADLSPTKEFLTFSTPASRRESFMIRPQAPETPIMSRDVIEDGSESAWGSPTTPYYLSKGAQLVQQTCPPKQTQELLFPLSGNIEDQPNEIVRQRLLMARRKSLQWTSKVQSPLGRTITTESSERGTERHPLALESRDWT